MFSLLICEGSYRRFSFYFLFSLVAAHAPVVMINAVASIIVESFLLDLFIATPPWLSDLFAPCHTVIHNGGFSTALRSGSERTAGVDPLPALKVERQTQRARHTISAKRGAGTRIHVVVKIEKDVTNIGIKGHAFPQGNIKSAANLTAELIGPFR